MERLKNTGLAILSGVLLFLAWPPLPFFPLLMVGFVPLFVIFNNLKNSGKGFLFYVWLALFIWNLLTTWWVAYASAGGAVAMILANTALMMLPFLAFRFSTRLVSLQRSRLLFIFFWLAMEYLHLNWDISFPWLTLGNGLAKYGEVIQWYEYTGILGGSCWILCMNVLIAQSIESYTWSKISITLGVFMIPIAASFGIKYMRNDAETGAKVLVIQPNINPYEKFNEGGELNQVKLFLKLAEERIEDSTLLMVLPETAIVEYLNEDDWNNHESIQRMISFCREHPGLQILTGASTYRFFKQGEKVSETARKSLNGEMYDSYNTALLIGEQGVLNSYHKSKLVPGVEKMPYPRVLGFMEYFAIDMGGITGSLGLSDEPAVFSSGPWKLAPAICYESIYGEYLGEFVHQGANVLAIITNDGWWKNTDGYKQHLLYGRMRAIEHRLPIVRCANTGTSAFIDASGNIHHATKWWEPAAFTIKVPVLKSNTFYTRSGDYIGKIAGFLSVFFLTGLMVKKWTNRK